MPRRAKADPKRSGVVTADPSVYMLRTALQAVISGLITAIYFRATGSQLSNEYTIVLVGAIMSAVAYLQNALEQGGLFEPLFKGKALADDAMERTTQRMIADQMEFLRKWYDEGHADPSSAPKPSEWSAQSMTEGPAGRSLPGAM